MLSKIIKGLRYIFTCLSILIWIFIIAEIFTALPRYRKWKAEGTSALLFYKVPFLEHRLRPFYERSYENGAVRVNALGLRGDDISFAKPKDVFRIVCIGESTTFGLGSSSNDYTYPALLEKYLRGRQNNPALKIEVINAGIPSYTSFQCYELLGMELIALKPDAVIIFTGWNEIGASMSSEWNNDYRYGFRYQGFREQNKNFFQFIRLDDLLNNSYFVKWLRKQAEHARAALHLPQPPAHLPKVYYSGNIEDVAMDVWENNLRNMISLAKANGIRVILFTWPQLPNIKYDAHNLSEIVSEVPRAKIILDDEFRREWNSRYKKYQDRLAVIANEEKVYIVDAAGKFLKLNNLPLYYDDLHLSDAGNKVLAEELGRFIVENVNLSP